MKTHEHISDLQPHEVSRFRAGFIADVKDRAFNVDAAVTMADGKLTTIDPASVEYALALTALVTEENETMRRNFAYLMRFIAEIRPERGRGKMKTAVVPAKFNGSWPHQRLGHRTWTAFVESPPSGEVDNETRAFKRPPGLGWTKQYESNLSKGYGAIREIVGRALPEATEAEREAKVDEVALGAGFAVTQRIGEQVTLPRNLEAAQAAEAVSALASGAVTADDIRERGTEALTAPREKGARVKIGAVDRALGLVRNMTEAEVYEFKRRFQDYLRERVQLTATGSSAAETSSSASNATSHPNGAAT